MIDRAELDFGLLPLKMIGWLETAYNSMGTGLLLFDASDPASTLRIRRSANVDGKIEEEEKRGLCQERIY